MPEIRPSVISQDTLCAEVRAPPNAMVVFGASGDLARRKLLASVFEIFARALLDERFYLLGCGRTNLSDDSFREAARQAIREKVAHASAKDLDSFAGKLYYIAGDYDDATFYQRIKSRLSQLGKKHKVIDSLICYLAVPPFLYTTIVEHLNQAGLTCPEKSGAKQQARPERSRRAKLVVEKPFGRDSTSAAELNEHISRCFDESQIYRIDHYLGKETVQNILMFRFANTIFEAVWDRNYIDSVQITAAETVGVEHRASYYDKTGALRDMFQSHILQMLALVAMEPPASFEADRIRDEKVKLLRSIRPFDLDKLNNVTVRGQYGPGTINGQEVVGYRNEPGVDPQSKTETFVAAKLFIDNWRWSGVPFYLRTAKCLARKDTEIAIFFKNVPHSIFDSPGLEDIPPNVIVLQIQPEEGMSLSFQAKRPGSKICMSTLNMDFKYKSVFQADMPEAYQRLLLDCMVGDQTLFTRYDDVEVSWRLLTPVLEAWQKDDSAPYIYAAGSDSFPQADALIESDGRKWRSLGFSPPSRLSQNRVTSAQPL